MQPRAMTTAVLLVSPGSPSMAVTSAAESARALALGG